MLVFAVYTLGFNLCLTLVKRGILYFFSVVFNGFGFCDEEYINAVTEQLSKIQHTSNLYYTAPQAKLAELLCIRTGMKKVFFSNSGAEANECAIKAARKYSHATNRGDLNEINGFWKNIND